MTILIGDCREVMATLDAASVDAVVCDPPYELGFMGKGWDKAGVAFDPASWEAALRVLKPGGHLLAFGGDRTIHRMICAIEDAGFEIRHQIAWIHGQGFPKNHDFAALPGVAPRQPRPEFVGTPYEGGGFGTALKPAMELIVLARKPLAGTVAANVAVHGTGGLNIDACRIEGGMDDTAESWAKKGAGGKAGANGYAGQFSQGMKDAYARGEIPLPSGRWPANVCLDETAAALLDEQSGERPGCSSPSKARPVSKFRPNQGECMPQGPIYGDTGGASRFFYCAKASRSERNAGLDGMPEHERRSYEGGAIVSADHPETSPGGHTRPAANNHPTVKPIALMRWLVRLVTPPGGLVLDPFAGSGSTGVACAHEGFRFLGIEQDESYAEIARRRIFAAAPLFTEMAAD